MIDITKYLIKLSQEESQNSEATDELNYSKFYLDDEGNLYRVPVKGTTPFWSSGENSFYKFRYNWETREIEAFEKVGSNYEFIESSPLPVYDFLNEETPEYWYKIYLEDLLKN